LPRGIHCCAADQVDSAAVASGGLTSSIRLALVGAVGPPDAVRAVDSGALPELPELPDDELLELSELPELWACGSLLLLLPLFATSGLPLTVTKPQPSAGASASAAATARARDDDIDE
jgi:hypothetical protein